VYIPRENIVIFMRIRVNSGTHTILVNKIDLRNREITIRTRPCIQKYDDLNIAAVMEY
jgi:hypothetical protein